MRVPGRGPGGSVLGGAIGFAIVGALALTGVAAGDGAGKKGEQSSNNTPLRVAMASNWRARPPAEFGFSDSGPGFLKAAEEAAHAGSSVARLAVSWTNISEHGFQELDRVVAVLRANGVRPLLTVSDAPAWTNPDAWVDGVFHIRPPLHQFDDEFAFFYTMLARRYPDAVLQVWSEPNLEFYGKIPPDRYAELAEAAAAAVHAVNPDQTVIGAAPSPGDGAWRQYLRAVYSSLDPSIEVGVNLYPRKGRSLDNATRRLSKDFHRVKKIARGRPIWVTETGLASIQFGVQRQAKGSAQIYKILAGGNAEAVIFHRLIDPSYAINEWENSLGALTADVQPKPLYNRLRALRLRHLKIR
jgi:hypothetical protein